MCIGRLLVEFDYITSKTHTYIGSTLHRVPFYIRPIYLIPTDSAESNVEVLEKFVDIPFKQQMYTAWLIRYTDPGQFSRGSGSSFQNCEGSGPRTTLLRTTDTLKKNVQENGVSCVS